ncbi:unnamed protein product, partial [Brassica oleracea]
LIATPSEVAIATPFTESHEVHSTSCSEIDVTIPTLAATTQPTHIPQQFYRESETPLTYGKGSGFEVVGVSSSYNTTRGGRAIKPTQKLQEMEWTNVGGRCKKDRLGRSYNNH